MPVTNYEPTVRTNWQGDPVYIRRMGTADIDMVRDEMGRWTTGQPEDISDPAQRHFDFAFQYHLDSDSNLFLISENPDDGSQVYGVSAAYMGFLPRAILGYIVRLGETRVGRLMLSESLKTIFSQPHMLSVESLVPNSRARYILGRYHFNTEFERDDEIEVDIEKAVLNRRGYEKLLNEHPDFT